MSEDGMIPLRRKFRNKGLLSLLESQYPSISSADLAIELIEEQGCGGTIVERYRLYVPDRSGEMHRDRFFIRRTFKRGKIREIVLEGSIYFDQ